MEEARGSPTQVRGEGRACTPHLSPAPSPTPTPSPGSGGSASAGLREPWKQARGVLVGWKGGERLWLATSAPTDTPSQGPPEAT